MLEGMQTFSRRACKVKQLGKLDLDVLNMGLPALPDGSV
jgi:hypothetical protein